MHASTICSIYIERVSTTRFFVRERRVCVLFGLSYPLVRAHTACYCLKSLWYLRAATGFSHKQMSPLLNVNFPTEAITISLLIDISMVGEGVYSVNSQTTIHEMDFNYQSSLIEINRIVRTVLETGNWCGSNSLYHHITDAGNSDK